jgi:hypothetical protein
MKSLKNLMSKIEEKIRIYLSHRPRLYALIVGVGIVLFWRGIWHSTDLLHTYFSHFYQNSLTVDLFQSPWWDGPLSLIVGIIVLLLTGAFTSSFIGNELILSGLRGEKRLSQKTETEVKTEEEVIVDIKQELGIMSGKIEELEKEVNKKNVRRE